MASVNLFLKNPNAKNTTRIICVLTDGREFRVKISTGISIKPKHWSKRNQNVLSADPMSVGHNRFLADFKIKINDIYLIAKSKGIVPTLEYFQKELNPDPLNELTFWGIWDLYLVSKQGVFKHHSFVKFNALKQHLKKFEDETNQHLILDNITSELLEDLQNFFFHKQDLNTQSTQKYIGIFKMFLNWCVKRKYTVNSDFKNFTAIRQPDSLKVIMTDEDIKKLNEVVLGDKNHLKNVRALFLLACNTGLRYSDFSRIDIQHLKKGEDGYILEIRQIKTEDYVTIPLTQNSYNTVQELITGKIHAISNQKMNTYVKELCKLAGIDEPFEVYTYKGRNKTINTVPKFELVTTHTGRRTFATNLLNKGVPAEVVMQFTGHRDYKSFAKYVNIPKRAQMQIVRNALEGNMWVA